MNKMYLNNRLMSPEPGESGGGLPGSTIPTPTSPVLGEAPAPDITPPPGEPSLELNGLTPPAEVPPAEILPGETKGFYKSLPDNWRNEFVDSLGLEDQADKDKKVAQLERFSDFASLSKSFFNAQEKIRSGQLESGLPENATDDQIKDYREANDIPATAEDYKLSFDDGLVLGEADSDSLSGVFKTGHENNVSNGAMSEMVNSFLQSRQSQIEEQGVRDNLDMQTATKMTKELWGGDYQTNINMIQGLMSKLPESVRGSFENARFADGSALFNSPEVLSFLSDMARVANPAGTVVGNSNNPTQAMTDEIKTLEGRMSDDDWFKDTDAQTRLRNLYTAQENMTR